MLALSVRRALAMKPRREPRMIPNPLWCERCKGYGYLVGDAEWEPYAVQCGECAERRNAAQRRTVGEKSANKQDALCDHSYATGMRQALAMAAQGAEENAAAIAEQMRSEALRVLRGAVGDERQENLT